MRTLLTSLVLSMTATLAHATPVVEVTNEAATARTLERLKTECMVAMERELGPVKFIDVNASMGYGGEFGGERASVLGKMGGREYVANCRFERGTLTRIKIDIAKPSSP